MISKFRIKLQKPRVENKVINEEIASINREIQAVLKFYAEIRNTDFFSIWSGLDYYLKKIESMLSEVYDLDKDFLYQAFKTAANKAIEYRRAVEAECYVSPTPAVMQNLKKLTVVRLDNLYKKLKCKEKEAKVLAAIYEAAK